MSDPVLYHQDGPIVTITLNRPETRNAITDIDMVEALIDACSRLAADLTIRAAIVTGAGPAFCSGGNLKHLQERSGMFAGDALQLRESYRRGIQRLPLALYELEVPTIAAVNGPAFGAGCDLTLMCDVRIASETAVFAESFVKLGLIAGDGGAWLLPRAVGASRAAEMAFTGEPIDAATALEWGLVSRVVPARNLMEEARALAGRIAANPPAALRMTKRLIREGQRASLPTLLEMAAAMQAIAHYTADHQEALEALAEHRQPDFTGR